MAFTVRFKGSDKSIVLENNESILEVAIRAGVAVNYGCSNGSCGECIAKHIKGQVKSTKNSDYVFDRSQRDSSHFLMCSSTACSDLYVDAFLTLNKKHVTQTLNTRIKHIDVDDNGIVQLRVRVPRSKRLRFEAGQYAILRHIEWGQGKYAIASCPCNAQELEFYLHSNNDPFVSTLFKNVKKNEMLEVKAPLGDFIFSEDMHRPVVFFSYEMGFPAIKSLIEHIVSQESKLSIMLYHSGSMHSHFSKLCKSWKDSLDQLNYKILDKDMDSILKGLSRYIDCNDTTSDFYLSAPNHVNNIVVNFLLNKGISERNIFHQAISKSGGVI